MKSILPLTVVLLGAPFAAMAGGPVTPVIEAPVATPAPILTPPPAQWTGFYGGLSLGIGDISSNAPGNEANMGVGGLYLGYRYDYGNFVVGGELSYDDNNLDNSDANDNRINSSGALKLVVGKSLGQTLIYGSAGVVQADATIDGFGSTDTGYTIGIGADYLFNERWTIGGELATDRYDTFGHTGYDLNDTTLKVKLGFRF